ncbi:hypothetical protein ACJ3XI_10990 [Litorimonas sp. RW-G-Af-16]|uniref:hypothetical protein n=1 Tax=Litorimonas sp. RW-G-Af-16 TaxID=3241168 RepID=UPI00390CC8E6
MTIAGIELLALIGFLLAAYSVVANDAIQTLGTFLSSNAKRPWWVLWLYAASILVAVTVYGYYTQDGDIAFGRLNQLPYSEVGIQWYHVLPAAVLLFLTRFGIPVSTTFLVLTVFALTGGVGTEGVLGKMLTKSALGYVVALVAGGFVYLCIARVWSRWIDRTKGQRMHIGWVTAQWLSTAFLWWQWLAQDFANIFVFMPRVTTTAADGTVSVYFDPTVMIFGIVSMVILMAYVFASRGGKIQKIILNKTNTTDIRAAILVDLMFGAILFIFKEISDIPMSTTWVFMGLIAGRELAISYIADLRSRSEAVRDVSMDMARLFFGLIISIVLAVAVPWIATGNMPSF